MANPTDKPPVTSLDIDALKASVWQALSEEHAKPEIKALLDRAVTPLEVYYLMERWGTITIYDAFNLEPPAAKIPLVLEGASEHFVVYDRGSSLIAGPKDLFSLTRTLADGLKTAQALAREAYERIWVVELVGFEKYVRAAWVECQLLGDQYGRSMEIINYNPSMQDARIYKSVMLGHEMNVSPERGE